MPIFFLLIICAETPSFIENLALASQFFAEHGSTGVLEALSQVRCGGCYRSLDLYLESLNVCI
jgi:hypothetical protein